MKQVPTIRSSAQARLLLYKLIADKPTDVQKRLFAAHPELWEELLKTLEEELEKQPIRTINDNDADKLILARVFSFIERSTVLGLERQLKFVLGEKLWLGSHNANLLESFIEEHKRLIKSVQREQLDKIAFTLKRGINEGRLQKDIAKDIRNVTQIGKRRASLIARNGPLQYSGALTRHHQMNASIKKYRWQTSQDERVRDSHRDRNNTVYNWDGSGPHPRSEVNCRCDAVPVLD